VWPAGNRLAFSALAGIFGSNITVMNADGSGGVVHLTSSTGLKNTEPTWSPDRSQIAFTSTRALDGSNNPNTNNTSNIWVANSDGSGTLTPLTQLTALHADSFSPTWLFNGPTIVFCSARALDGSNNPNTNNTSNIWAMNADGSGAAPLTQLTAPGADSLFPVWSPDGSKIAFQSRRALSGNNGTNTNNIRNIWVMNADGSGATPLTQLTAAGTDSFSPTWMSDGKRIAFVSNSALDGSSAVNTNGAENLWIVNLDGTGRVPLTNLSATGVDVEGPVGQP
jgi:TolB protein